MITILQLVFFWALFDVPYILYRFILYHSYKRNLHTLEKPFVSVIIPAYNEEVGITKTLNSCLHQSYPNFEVIVVNDGSKDKTGEKVQRFKQQNPEFPLFLISQKNTGKAKAMNNALKHADADFVITLDADSKLHHHAIEHLMAKFSSNKIGGVAGNIVAISHGKIMGAIQKMEYEISTHFLRESQSAVGAVAVTPGAFSAYRRKALKKFEEGTLTEDFDTSVKVLEEGYDVVIAPHAVCFTQVPLSYGDIIRQRIRWQQGGLEVFSKHLFHKKKFFVSVELFLIFFFGFYGLFPKVLTFIAIPINFFAQDIGTFISGFLLFLAYFCLVWFIILAIIKEKRITTYLTVPLFVIYWYTLLFYSILAAQIIVFKKNKQWGTLKRYHT